MSSFDSIAVFAPVSNAFVEVAPATLVGLFSYSFAPAPQDPIYIRPGHVLQQNYAAAHGAEWLLYTRSVLSYYIQVRDQEGVASGASLIVEIGGMGLAAIPDLFEWRVFHLVPGNQIWSSMEGFELPGLMARFAIRTANASGPVGVQGSIIIRGL